MAQEKQAILLPDYLTVRELAEVIGASPIEVMKRLIANGIMASINQQIDYDTAAIVVEEMGFEAHLFDDNRRRVIVNLLINGSHNPVSNEAFHDLNRAGSDDFRKFADR